MKNVEQGRLWTRRRFNMVLPLLGAMPLVAGAVASPLVSQRGSRTLMGTKVDIVANGNDARLVQNAINKAFAEMQRLEAMMSRYRDDSVVRRLGAAAGQHAVAVPAEMMAVLRNAQQVYQQSAGAFDPTVGALSGWRFEAEHKAMPAPAAISESLKHVGAQHLQLDAKAGTAFLSKPGMALDLGGIAKLPILAAGLRMLEQEGIRDALINGGGDVLAMGTNTGRPWRVGVRDPRAPKQLLGAIDIQGYGIVASSGDYERSFMHEGRLLHHVLDPKTGWPTRGVPGVTLVADHVDAVNGWGTALMVQGFAAVPQWSQAHSNVAVLAANSDGDVWQSTGMQGMLKPVRGRA